MTHRLSQNPEISPARRRCQRGLGIGSPIPAWRKGALGIVTELIQAHGPDSFIGRLAATAYGSTETTFYVLAVYFGAVGIKKARHAVFAGLVADVVSIVAAITFCRLAFA